MTVLERINKHSVEQPNGCLRWPGAEKKRGRPYIVVNKVHKSAYRALWTEVIGPIPEGLTIDHLCSNKWCLNLEHMEVVSHSENYQRFNRVYQENNPNFICGHPKTGEVLVSKSKGKTQRRCAPCSRAYYREYMKDYLPKYKEAKRATANGIH